MNISFTSSEKDLIDKLTTDDAFLRYVCNLWYAMGDQQEVAEKLGVSDDFFLRAFSVYPDLEHRFDEVLEEVASKMSHRINVMTIPTGLRRVSDIVRTASDEKMVIQGASLHLQYYLKTKPPTTDSDDLDDIFREIEMERKKGGKEG